MSANGLILGPYSKERDALIFMLGAVVLGIDPNQLGGIKKKMMQDSITHGCEALGINRNRSDWVEMLKAELIALRDRKKDGFDF